MVVTGRRFAAAREEHGITSWRAPSLKFRVSRRRICPSVSHLCPRVLRMLRRKGLLTPERIKLLQSWEHSRFNVDASARIGADDAAGRENLSRYLIRAPFSMNKIRYDPAAQTVIYKTIYFSRL